MGAKPPLVPTLGSRAVHDTVRVMDHVEKMPRSVKTAMLLPDQGTYMLVVVDPLLVVSGPSATRTLLNVL